MAGPRIGLFGTFDLENYGDLLFPRLFERELRERLPSVEIRAFSPYGPEHPVAMNRGWAPEALGLWTRERLRELGDALDLVVVGGGEIIHTRDELLATSYGVDPLDLRLRRPSDFFLEYPAAWHAVGIPFDFDPYERRLVAAVERPYVAVRDERSRARLDAAGAGGGVVIVPDPAFALDRLFPPATLDAARDELRARDAYPAEGRPLVLQGSAALLEHVDALARSVGERPVVLLEIGRCHGDDRFADAMAARLGEHVHRVRGDASLEEIAAAIAGGSGYAGISMHGAISAMVYGVPTLILDLGRDYYSKLAGLTELLGRDDLRATAVPDRIIPLPAPDVAPLQVRLAEHYDRLAALARERSSARVPGGPAADGELLRRRLLEERRRYADLVAEVGAERDALRYELSEAKRYIASLEWHLRAKEESLDEAQRMLAEREPPAEGARPRFGFIGRRPR
jgi:lipopolysaccharide transport system ATP-binding protein